MKSGVYRITMRSAWHKNDVSKRTNNTKVGEILWRMLQLFPKAFDTSLDKKYINLFVNVKLFYINDNISWKFNQISMI